MFQRQMELSTVVFLTTPTGNPYINLEYFLKLPNNQGMTLAKVLLVEDDVFVRTTLSGLLSHRGFEVVGEVQSAEEALLLQQVANPHVLIVDLDLGPGPNGIDIATAMRNQNSQIGIIMLTSFSDPRFADSRNLPLPQGTIFFRKNEIHDISTLTTAILQVNRNPLIRNRTSLKIQNPLTSHQIEILKLLSEGHTTSSIAQLRNVSEKSIEAMISRIHSNLDLPKDKKFNPRVQLVRAYFSLTGRMPPGD